MGFLFIFHSGRDFYADLLYPLRIVYVRCLRAPSGMKPGGRQGGDIAFPATPAQARALKQGVMPNGAAIWGDARKKAAFPTTVRIHGGLRSWVPAAIGPGSSPGIRMTRNSASPAKAGVSVRHETPACAGDAVLLFRRYLPAPVSSGVLHGVMPDGDSHLGIHSSRRRDPQTAHAVGGDALRGAGLIRRSSSSITLPRMPFHGPGQDPSGWDGVMILGSVGG